MRKGLYLLAGLAAAAIGFAAPEAEAGDWRNQCRDYTRIYKDDGRRVVSYGTACRDRNGIWNVVSEQRYPKSRNIYTNVLFKGDQYFSKVYYPVNRRSYDENHYSQGPFRHHDRYREHRPDRFNDRHDGYRHRY